MVAPTPTVVPRGDQDWEVLVPLDALSAWMDGQGIERGPIENPRILGGGTQYILLKFERGAGSFVLRAPRSHLRVSSNETMRRDAHIRTALRSTVVSHP